MIIDAFSHALSMAFAMGWEILWPLCVRGIRRRSAICTLAKDTQYPSQPYLGGRLVTSCRDLSSAHQ
jgi:hypothetical protein